MRAILIDAWTTPDRLQVRDAPVPTPGPDEVLIEVAAAPLSFSLSLLIAGKYQRKPPLPFVPGNTVAGRVVSRGARATRFAPGARVLASLEWGGLAEFATAHQANVYAIPDAVGFAEATTFNTSYNSVLAALTWPHLLAIQPGQTLLVLGAAGGTGTAAIEIGRLLGATVIAAASTPAKRDWALRHGAHHAVASDPVRLRDDVLALAGAEGVDAVLDPVGGAMFAAGLRCLRREGRILPLGFASGEIPQLAVNLLLVKNIAVCGLYMGYYKIDARERYEPRVRALFDRLGAWAAQGQIKPEIAATLPLEQITEGFARLLDRNHLGHVVMAP